MQANAFQDVSVRPRRICKPVSKQQILGHAASSLFHNGIMPRLCQEGFKSNRKLIKITESYVSLIIIQSTGVI